MEVSHIPIDTKRQQLGLVCIHLRLTMDIHIPYGSVSKPCTPVVHIKIAGIYGCSFP